MIVLKQMNRYYKRTKDYMLVYNIKNRIELKVNVETS